MYQAMQRPTNRPSQAQQSQFNMATYADPLIAALTQFGINPIMEMIPGKFTPWTGVRPMPTYIEGKPYDLPAGMTEGLFKALMGSITGAPLREGRGFGASGLKDPRIASTSTFSYERPAGVGDPMPVAQTSTKETSAAASAAQTAKDQGDDLGLIFLLRNYPELLELPQFKSMAKLLNMPSTSGRSPAVGGY